VCASKGGGTYVFTSWIDHLDSPYFLPFISVSGVTVRINRHFLTLVFLVFFSMCGPYGCNRPNRVQAAGENADDVAQPSERDFLMKATQAHLAEIDMARMAKMQSRNGDVKSYAKMVLKDHADALENAAKLINDTGSSQPRTLAAETKKDIQRMSQLSGPEFDREFVNMMVADHQKSLELFRTASGTVRDTKVQDYVDGLIPKLEKHLKKAQELQSKLFSRPAGQKT
jgi:putative membrane protein